MFLQVSEMIRLAPAKPSLNLFREFGRDKVFPDSFFFFWVLVCFLFGPLVLVNFLALGLSIGLVRRFFLLYI